MRIRVEYTAQLRRLAGVGHDQLELADGADLTALAEAVATQRPTAAAMVRGSDGGLATGLLPFVGGKQAARDIVLRDGDHVLLLAPISGG